MIWTAACDIIPLPTACRTPGQPTLRIPFWIPHQGLSHPRQDNTAHVRLNRTIVSAQLPLEDAGAYVQGILHKNMMGGTKEGTQV